jgi:hypothetical protein
MSESVKWKDRNNNNINIESKSTRQVVWISINRNNRKISNVYMILKNMREREKMQSSIGKIKTKQIAWHLRVKLIIETATGGKMPDLIKKKIDHRLDCHHYHFTTVSLYVGHWSQKKTMKERKKHCPSIMISIFAKKKKISILLKKKWHMHE